jgi:hypothetical protein
VQRSESATVSGEMVIIIKIHASFTYLCVYMLLFSFARMLSCIIKEIIYHSLFHSTPPPHIYNNIMISPLYLEYQFAVFHMLRNTAIDMRLLIMVRNPIARACSRLAKGHRGLAVIIHITKPYVLMSTHTHVFISFFFLLLFSICICL